jgi:CheY-like chemotaxis protein
VGNAAKYTPPGGRISVSVARRDESAVVQVEDSGVGLAPELIPRVFDLFVQGERSLDRSSGGLGIGLTLVKRLVELHGGHVAAASAGPGRGSRFTVSLPAIEPPREQAPAQAPRDPGAVQRRILLVEDNDDAREMMRVALESYGHRVFEACDGAAGVGAAADTNPEVVVIDVGLPGIDGYDVARRLRATPERAGTLLIALTGYGQPEARQHALEAGFDAHLTKPVAPDRLARLIDTALGTPSGRPDRLPDRPDGR